MLTSINPLGERIRGNRWLVTVAWLTVGGVLGGAAVGAAAGGIGSVVAGELSTASRSAVLVVVFALAALWDLLDLRFPGRRQVDENWLTAFRGWVYGIGFGAQLGAGLATVVNTALVPAMLVAAALVDDVVAATLMGAVFGATRGLTVLLAGAVRNPDDLRDLHRRVDTLDVGARRAGAAVSGLLGVVAALALGG